jgi:sulfate adenylyltransferase subunit 1
MTAQTPGPDHTPELLRLATAGSVDDGKSTLVGRLLYDTKSVLADQIDAIIRASVDRGLSTPDLSLLVDGLRAEREQGITIDVAYRYFATPKRSFILADTPGHVQYTRNTVSGASTAQLAVLLVDARKGVLAQTRRHAAVLALLGVPRLVLAVNKIDLVADAAIAFTGIASEFAELARRLGWPAEQVQAIPVSALHGDNIAEPSGRTPYYDGPTLIEHLETVPVHDEHHSATTGLRFPVQYVIRPRTPEHIDYRGYAGQVAAGSARTGDEIVVWPGGTRTTIARIDTADGPVHSAPPGRAVTLMLADDIDVSRGAMIAAAADVPDRLSTFEATVCWLDETPLQPGARLLLKHGTSTTDAVVSELTERFDEQELCADANPASLGLNDIGCITIRVATPLTADHYTVNRGTGSFLLIDPVTGNTLAAGLIGNVLGAVEIGADSSSAGAR